MVLLLSSVDKEDNWNLLKFIGGHHVGTNEADQIKPEWNYSHCCHIISNQTESTTAQFSKQPEDWQQSIRRGLVYLSQHDNKVLPILTPLRSNSEPVCSLVCSHRLQPLPLSTLLKSSAQLANSTWSALETKKGSYVRNLDFDLLSYFDSQFNILQT